MKTKQYIKTLLLSLLAVSALAACSDYLEVEPTNGVRTDNFYLSPSQVDNALTGLYGTLKPIPKYLFAMSEIRSDNVWVLVDTKQNDYADVATFNANGLLTDNIVKNCWADYFKIVATANVLLSKIDGVTFDSDDIRVQYIASSGEGNPMVCLSVPSNPGLAWCGNNLVTGTHLYIEKQLQNYFITRDSQTGEYLDLRIEGTMNTRPGTGEEGESYTPTGNTFYVKFFENRVKRAALGYSDMDASTVDGTYKAFKSRVTKDMYLYPIPQSQMEVRKGLYKQNTGY